MVVRSVVIENSAKLNLLKAYLFIRKRSYQNAEKVREKILESIAQLALNPEQYPPDKYCDENDGSFRALRFINIELPIILTKLQLSY